jgi:ferredoxin
MKVSIDEARCQGHQMCAVVAPEVFGADEIGNAVIMFEGDVPAELEAKTRRGASNCPENAIIIVEG